MGERIDTASTSDLPPELEGAYCSLGNKHTYLVNSEEKAGVISRAAFDERFSVQQGDVSLDKSENEARSLTIAKEYAIVPTRTQIKQKQITTLHLERHHHEMTNANKYNGDSRRGSYTPEEVKQAKEQYEAEQQAEYDAWNSSLVENGGSVDDAHKEALRNKKLNAFNRAKDEVYNGSVQGRRLFTLANQVRVARIELEQKYPELVKSGEYANNAEFNQLLEDRVKSFNLLKEKYADSVSEEHQQFIAEFGNGDYDDLFETEVKNTPQAAVSEEVNQPADNDEETLSPEEIAQASSTANHTQPTSIKIPRDRGFVDAYGEDNPRVPESRAMVPVEEEEYWTKTWPTAPEHTRSKVENNENGESSSEPELDIENLLRESRPELYDDYANAWNEYVTASANARYADLGAAISGVASKRGGWLERARNKVGEIINTNGHKKRVALEEFEKQSTLAIEAALDEYGKIVPMSEVERKRNKMLLEANQAEELEWVISEERAEIDAEKTTFSHKVMYAGGIATAVVGGVVTAIADGRGRGDNHYALFTSAVVFGAGAGYIAAKGYRDGSENTEEAIAARAAEARKIVVDYSDDSEGGRSMAVHATEYMTTAKQEKNLSNTVKSMAASAVFAGLAHGAADTLSSANLNLNLYNGDGLDLNPLDGDGIDLNPVDNDSVIQSATDASDGQETEPKPNPTPAPIAAEAVAPTAAPTEVVATPVATPDNSQATVLPGEQAVDVPTGDGNGSETPLDLTGGDETTATPPAEELVDPKISDHEKQDTTSGKGPATENTADATNESESVPIEPIDPTESLNKTFDVEAGNGVTQEMEQAFVSNGLPVPSDEKLAATVAAGVKEFGPSGIIEGVTLVLSPDGTEYWIPEPVQGVKWTPEYLDFVLKSSGK